MTIYIVLKAAKEQTGEFVFNTVEKAFQDREQAETYLSKLPVVWEENINGALCYCERAVIEAQLE